MSILDTLAARNNAASSKSARPAAEDRPVAQTWMNIGYMAGDEFINLPLGLAIDTMEPVVAKGQSEKWIQTQTARNELLKAIQQAGDELKPGEFAILPLQIQIRRVNDQVVIDPEHNPYSMENSGFSLTVVK